jgi:hypothetical protein
MGNLIIRAAFIFLMSSWPILAGLIGFAISAIADSAGDHWAKVAIVCVTTAAVTIALLADLAAAP